MMAGNNADDRTKIIKKDGDISNHLARMYARELFISGSDEDFLEAKRLEGDVEFMLRLVDLIFGFEPDRLPPS